jgi:hypothetical protein
VFQFANRLVNISVGQVRSLLDETLHDTGRPAARQFLERADIEIPIVEKTLQLRHVAGQKSPVLADAVATHRGGPALHQGSEKFQGASFRFCFSNGAGANPRGEAG